MKKICLCIWCIAGMRSHGECVFVGDQYYDEDAPCVWCDEANEDRYECIIE